MNFIIVGAQKSGTSSLFEYLSKQPGVFMPTCKEVDFFSRPERYSKGIEHYKDYFSKAHKDACLGEASPQYMYFRETAELIYKSFPEVKIIMCLRDPIERAYSHYNMNKRKCIESLDFENIIEKQLASFKDFYTVTQDPQFNYIGLGCYGSILESYLEYFSLDNIKIVWSDSLRFNRLDTIKEILSFIGIDSEIDPLTLDKEYHVGGKQKFELLYRMYRRMSVLSPQMNTIIKKIFGKDNVSGILYRIETSSSRQNNSLGKSCSMRTETYNNLKSFYSKDAIKLEENSNKNIPWVTEWS